MKPEISEEIYKQCEKCGFAPLFTGTGYEIICHSVRHRPSRFLYSYGGNPVVRDEAMVFECVRCGYEWEVPVAA